MLDKHLITVDPLDLACPGSPLRMPSEPLTDLRRLGAILAQLREVLYSIEYAAGLAAIQIGLPVRVAIVNLARTPDAEKLLINPVVLQITGRPTARREGCLSLPHYSGPVMRRNKIMVRSLHSDGVERVFQATGYESAVVQHELDHMSGVLYWDRMEAAGRPLPRGELEAGVCGRHSRCPFIST